MERRSPGGESDPLRRGRRELHQPDRSGGRAGVRAELRLLVDDGGEQRRVEAFRVGARTDEGPVVERVPESLEPRRARLEHVRRDPREQHGKQTDRERDPSHHLRSSMTDLTNCSSSSSDPVFV